MKKKVLAVLLSTAMLTTILAGCGSSDSSSSDTEEAETEEETEEVEEEETEEAEEETEEVEEEAAEETEEVEEEAAEEEAAEETEESAELEITDGRVYLLNFKPETDEAWQDLADVYNDLGGNVVVLTAADGEYDTTLTSEMSKNEAPTIFNVSNSAGAATWDDYTYDLSDTAIYDHLTDKSLTVTYNGKVAGVANCYEAFGIIYNKTILEDYCTMDDAVVTSIDEIDDLDTLEAVAEDINNRVDEINETFGYELEGAFSSSGLDDGSSWRFSGHLANLPLYYEFVDDGVEDVVAGEAEIDGTYLDNYKRVWDMYISTSAADPATLSSGAYNAESELGLGEAVFYQNGDWEYSALTNEENGYTVTADDLDMMPIYFGVDDENEGLCVGTENHWAINSQCTEEEIEASLTFLEWVITSDEGRSALVNDMGLSCPFDTFTGDYESQNPFGAKANELAAEGKTSIGWAFNATPNVDDWRADVVAALTAYTDGSGEWDAVETAFVDGWATQWALAEEAAE